MATTPSPRAIVDNPPTPLHGAKFDTFQPSSTRKATRQSTRRAQRAAHTPPPASTIYSSTSRTLANTYSPPSSNPTSPQIRANKRRRGNPAGGIDTATSTASSVPGVYMDPFTASGDGPQPEQGVANLGPNMLPTPAKTPRKKDLGKTAELQSAARVLFPSRLEKVEDAMPNKKNRRGKKNVGFSLDSSSEEEDPAGRIQIYTDSKEKIPELDMSEDNPFIDRPETSRVPEPHKSIGRHGRKAPVKTNPHIEDAFNREEGMVYVFRGKKIFRRFTPDPDHPNISSEETEIEGSVSPRLRPSTRASVKPRLLFPTEKQRREREVAEEAPTDIEDELTGEKEEKVVTPIKQSFAPATPPTTGRATRSATKKATMNGDSSPLGSHDLFLEQTTTSVERRPRKKTSPFEGWQRTKGGSAVQRKGRKRGAEGTEEAIETANKRSRPNASA
ncbi:MAG: hypothetical protein Q9225_003522 [Loekoesia sp. 1 TL-2023]